MAYEGILQAGQSIGAGLANLGAGLGRAREKQLQDIFQLQSMEPEQQQEAIPQAVRLGVIPNEQGQEMLGRAIVRSSRNKQNIERYKKGFELGGAEGEKEMEAARFDMMQDQAIHQGEGLSTLQVMEQSFKAAQEKRRQFEQYQDYQQAQAVGDLFERSLKFSDPSGEKGGPLYKQSLETAITMTEQMLNQNTQPGQTPQQVSPGVKKALLSLKPQEMRWLLNGIQQSLQAGNITPKELLPAIFAPGETIDPLERIREMMEIGKQGQPAGMAMVGESVPAAAPATTSVPAPTAAPSAAGVALPTGEPAQVTAPSPTQDIDWQIEETQTKIDRAQQALAGGPNPAIEREYARYQSHLNDLMKQKEKVIDKQVNQEFEYGKTLGKGASDAADIALEPELQKAHNPSWKPGMPVVPYYKMSPNAIKIANVMSLHRKAENAAEQARLISESTPLSGTAVDIVRNSQINIQVISDIQREFGPAKIQKYISKVMGLGLEYTAKQWAQVYRQDPEFARFNALLMRVKGTAFGDGGKQLTPFEAGIVFGYTPTGEEKSVQDFMAKLKTARERFEDTLQSEFAITTTPKGKLKGVIEKQIKERTKPTLKDVKKRLRE